MMVFARTGEALHAWGRVEDSLCTIFMTAISSRNYKATHAAFFAIVSFDAKLSVADVAVRAALEAHTSHLEHWARLEKALRKKKAIRNKLAHSQTLYQRDRNEARLMPYYSVTGPALPEWNGGWTVSNIEAHIRAFADLNNEQIVFLKQLREDLGMWPTDWRPVQQPDQA